MSGGGWSGASIPYRNACDPDVPCTTLILSRTLPVGQRRLPGAGRRRAALGRLGRRSATGAVRVHRGRRHTRRGPEPKDNQQVQTALLASRLAAFDRRSLIVAGDFNSTPWSFSLRRQDALFALERRTRALFTFPVRTYSRYRLHAPFPLFPIDQIYAGSDWKTVSVTRGPRLGSDHLPTIAILTR